MIIYKTTNLVSGKVYIGKARGIRVSNCYLGSGIALKKAVAKYGTNNFERKTIDICESIRDQNHKEIFWIKFYREKLGKDCVYNVSDGGDGRSFGHMHSKETKKKISDLLKGEKHPMFGFCHSEEAKLKMSKAHLGKLFSDETRKKMKQPKSKEHSKNIGLARIGMKFSEKQRLNMSNANKGQIPWMKGKRHTEESLEKMQIAQKSRRIAEREQK